MFSHDVTAAILVSRKKIDGNHVGVPKQFCGSGSAYEVKKKFHLFKKAFQSKRENGIFGFSVKNQTCPFACIYRYIVPILFQLSPLIRLLGVDDPCLR